MERMHKSALEVISTLHKRPSPEEALGLTDQEIIDAAEALGFPVWQETMNKIFNVHTQVLPLVENLLTRLLNGDGMNVPDYYPLARDGELLYDALWGLGQAPGSTLAKRTHFTKTSLDMRSDVGPEYFNSLGITNDRVENGTPLIFLDSGFRGSLFRGIAKWTGILHEIPNKNFRGYLVSSETSCFYQMKFAHSVGYMQARGLEDVMRSSPYLNFCYKNSINETICAFMQLMPKFTGKYVKPYQREDGVWDVLPQQNKFVKKWGIKSTTNASCGELDSTQINSINRESKCVNEDVVDPIVSLLLQRRALQYFSDPNVHDRVYSWKYGSD